jgi:nucleoside-diphosphate-sugar epimerase
LKSFSQESILVTGALGFIGKALCNVFSNCNLSFIPVRLSEIGSEDLALSLQQCRVVVHLAARVHVMRDTEKDPLMEYRRTNVEGTASLARKAAAAGVKRFIFMSSIKVNGESTKIGQRFKPDDTPTPKDPYGISKLEAEHCLRQISEETGMEIVIIRPPLVYGAGVKANFAALMQAVQNGWPLPLGAVNNQRSLISLTNLVDFIKICTDHPAARNNTFLISDAQDISTSELVTYMAKAAGKPARLLRVPVPLLRLGGYLFGRTDFIERLCGNLQIDSSKAHNLLGWAPVITVEEGLMLLLCNNPKINNVGA